jgi:hypothetical protein
MPKIGFKPLVSKVLVPVMERAVAVGTLVSSSRNYREQARTRRGSAGLPGKPAQPAVQTKQFAIFFLISLPTVLTFSHCLKQIGFSGDVMSTPDLDLAANSFVLRK